MDTINYFLALEKRPGDSQFIDVSKLDISNGYNPQSLDALDSFTMHFTKEELKNAIKEDNLVEESYLAGRLIIIDSIKKHHYEVIDKDILGDFQIDNFLKERINNKELMNNIIYKYKIMLNDEERFLALKKAQENQDINDMCNIILSTNYLIQRNFILYLLNLLVKERKQNKEKQELIRDKAA